LRDLLAGAPVIPLIQADDPATAVAVARALAAAGMPLVEVVQRTDASLECLAAVAEALPALVTGAGTVLSADQCTACIVNGARFVVSPGLDRSVVECAAADGVAALPGIMTPSELQLAHNLGLDTVKFFPAATAGGVGALRALASVFRRMRFVPTGGISASNLGDYLALPSVIACGGSWLTPADAIAAGDFGRITQLAREALAIADAARDAAR
jgi:2-dehydro-3-deoxyphosphogluconate aldolase/(4S)-4-hydroxy-2-oxoglutarate aldolase